MRIESDASRLVLPAQRDESKYANGDLWHMELADLLGIRKLIAFMLSRAGFGYSEALDAEPQSLAVGMKRPK
jgi:hypothetical protein